jgi:hypothetical protein
MAKAPGSPVVQASVDSSGALSCSTPAISHGDATAVAIRAPTRKVMRMFSLRRRSARAFRILAPTNHRRGCVDARQDRIELAAHGGAVDTRPQPGDRLATLEPTRRALRWIERQEKPHRAGELDVHTSLIVGRTVRLTLA